MSRIDFHVHVSDKLAYSCRLLRKACLSGARVAVVAEPEVLVALDELLWQFSPVEFVPHCRAGASEAALAASPIVLNLGRDVPAGFEAFERLIDVVAAGDDEVTAGRGRWKHYVALGHSPEKHQPGPSKGAP
ncbi:MAG: DNA polymerase III subunit chi [Polaromonas sp.]|nr:DNA polymerase III subunit chi [Polaromonas sp.]